MTGNTPINHSQSIASSASSKPTVEKPVKTPALQQNPFALNPPDKVSFSLSQPFNPGEDGNTIGIF